MNAPNTIFPSKNKIISLWVIVPIIVTMLLVATTAVGTETAKNVLEKGSDIGESVIEKGAEVEKIVVAKNYETKELVEQKGSEAIQEIGEIILDDYHGLYFGIGIIILVILFVGIVVANRKKSESHPIQNAFPKEIKLTL